MSKINEYPQAVTINNNDLFVIDQESGGDHATKSASVSQISEKALDGVTAGSIPLGSDFTDPTSTAGAIAGKQDKITYHQETTTPDSGGVFNTGVSIDKVPLSCTSGNGYVSGFVYSGGYWYGRIVNYAGSPVTTAVTVSTWYIDNPS